MDDSASGFWDKYNLKTTSYNVPERARRWYVRYAEVFIKAHSGRRLAALTADDIEHYLKEKGRSEKLTDWQFRQMDDALRILFIGLVSPAWANKFDWFGWKAGARELPADNANVAASTPDAGHGAWPKSAALAPKPRVNLTRFHGMFAPTASTTPG